MLKYIALAALSFTIATPAFAFNEGYQGGSNQSMYGEPKGDGYGSPKNDAFGQRLGNDRYQQEEQRWLEPREQQTQEPTFSRIRLSGSGNGSARLEVIKMDQGLLDRINAGQINTRSILIGRVDLNRDGKEEIFAFNEAPEYCNGDYCPFSVYQVVRGQGLRPLLQGYMTTNEIGVLDRHDRRGWLDIVAYDRRGRETVLQYNGSSYDQGRRRRGGWR